MFKDKGFKNNAIEKPEIIKYGLSTNLKRLINQYIAKLIANSNIKIQEPRFIPKLNLVFFKSIPQILS
jgi:hypothetical protein